MVVPYLSDLSNAIFQKDKARLQLRIVFQSTNSREFPELPWTAGSLYLSPIDNVWSWVAQRLTSHSSSATAVNDVWHRLEAALNELPASVIQALID